MKVIFLDIDGVFNYAYCRHLIHGMYFVNPKLIKLFKRIVDETNAKIVLSSTWRFGWDLICGNDSEDFKALRKAFNKEGLDFFDKTPNLGDVIRGKEIECWIRRQEKKGEHIENYVIIDDDTDFTKEQLPHFIRTSWATGLREKHINKAIKILNGGKNEA